MGAVDEGDPGSDHQVQPWGHRPMLGHVAVEAFIWGLHPRPPSPVQPQGNGQLRAHPFQQTASGAQLWTHPWL